MRNPVSLPTSRIPGCRFEASIFCPFSSRNFLWGLPHHTGHIPNFFTSLECQVANVVSEAQRTESLGQWEMFFFRAAQQKQCRMVEILVHKSPWVILGYKSLLLVFSYCWAPGSIAFLLSSPWLHAQPPIFPDSSQRASQPHF